MFLLSCLSHWSMDNAQCFCSWLSNLQTGQKEWRTRELVLYGVVGSVILCPFIPDHIINAYHEAVSPDQGAQASHSLWTASLRATRTIQINHIRDCVLEKAEDLLPRRVLVILTLDQPSLESLNSGVHWLLNQYWLLRYSSRGLKNEQLLDGWN